MILLQLRPMVAWPVRGFILMALTAILLFAHGCHGDNVDHELSVPVPLQPSSEE